MKNFLTAVLAVLAILFSFLLVVAPLMAIGVIAMLLWNWLVPSIFGGPTMHLLEAWGLLLLAAITSKVIQA